MTQASTATESVPMAPEALSALMPNAEQRSKMRRIRNLKDQLSRYGVTTAGIAVVGSLGLIFCYLFSEVFPLLKGASVDVVSGYSIESESKSSKIVYSELERYEEIGALYRENGSVDFFNTKDGKLISHTPIARAEMSSVTSNAASLPVHGLFAYGFNNGQVSVVKSQYDLSYANDKRSVSPSIVYPLGEQPLVLDTQQSSLTQLAVQETAKGILVAASNEQQKIFLAAAIKEVNKITEEETVSQKVFELPSLPDHEKITHIQLDETGRYMVVSNDKSQLYLFNISNPESSERYDPVTVPGGQITALEFLVTSGSLAIGTSEGRVQQWLLVRDENNRYHLTHVRDFKSLSGSIKQITPEYSRRGFWATDDKGNLGVYFGTSDRTLLVKSFGDKSLISTAISPIYGYGLLVDADQNVHVAKVWNQHPEVSFSMLWEKVWYEGRDAPDYIWQASSASDSFEAKMSFVPLAIGTLKAAFFAILFAVPIGVTGAIYTAYFMTPKLRGIVKPTIEIMAALPSVILGFMAGLWLAPFLENHLLAIFGILFLLPVVMFVTGFAWSQAPVALRQKLPEGWEAIILLIPIVVAIWAIVEFSPVCEVLWFSGSLRQWISDQGMTYEQRNALVVGLAMGFAVIPTIFTIAEDAVFSVPKHLTQGSLALGATRWQTVVGVVLPTASPGIFSAVMMGFGRAVGETMIVLMATGNSPVVNFNVFEGMRTLSANIAVEMPETAVGSTHFRVLFLAALLLLAMTFVVNTLAEIIRQRLRKRYSNL